MPKKPKKARQESRGMVRVSWERITFSFISRVLNPGIDADIMKGIKDVEDRFNEVKILRWSQGGSVSVEENKDRAELLKAALKAELDAAIKEEYANVTLGEFVFHGHAPQVQEQKGSLKPRSEGDPRIRCEYYNGKWYDTVEVKASFAEVPWKFPVQPVEGGPEDGSPFEFTFCITVI